MAEGRRKIIVYSFMLAVAAALVFSPAFKAGFLPWDDKEYVAANNDIRSFSGENIKKIFSESYVGNYQPVTMLSYMADYAVGGENPLTYHLSNVLFHAANAILLMLLLLRIFGNTGFAFAGALVFAVHPVQAESVMWIAERKNVLYAFFFLLASLQYVIFIDHAKWKNYTAALVFFMLSLLSKGAAVAFPLCLFAYDLLLNKKITLRSTLQKIPFFALAIAAGCVLIHTQEKDGFLNPEHEFDLFTRVVYAGYAFCVYIAKFLVPVSLSSYYPYPKAITWLHYGTTALALLAVVAFFLLIRKKRSRAAGALLFFAANIVFVLQFIPFGEVLVAERYNYLGMAGLIMLCGLLLVQAKEKFRPGKFFLPVMLSCIVIIFSVTCLQRNKTWKDSFTFYGDILKKFPDSYIVMNSLGAEYMHANDFKTAQEWFDKAKKENPNDHSVYYNEGLNYLKQNKVEEAYNSLSRSIELKKYHKALFARANILEKTKQYTRAISDLDEVIRQKPQMAEAYYLRGLCKEQASRLDESLADYDRAIALKPGEALFYLNKGIAMGKMEKIQEAMALFDKAIALKPDYAQAFYLRALSKYRLKINPCGDLKKAMELGYSEAEKAALQLCRN